MKLASHLRRSRHGIFYFRLTLPPAIAIALGQLELQRSLGTRSPSEARALGYHIWANFSPKLLRLEEWMSGRPLNIDPKDIKKLVIEGLDVRPDGSYSVQKLVTSDDPAVAHREMEAFKQMVSPRAPMPHEVEREAKRQAEIAKDRALLEDILLGAPKKRPPRAESLEKAFEAYMGTKKGIAPSTQKSYRESFELFAILVGGKDRQTDEVTDAELSEFNEALAHVPLHATKRGYKLCNASEMRKNPVPTQRLPDGTEAPVPMIGAGTANAHRTNILSFFDFLINSFRRDGPNPLARSQRHSDGEAEGGAEAFTEPELRKIFDPASFMESTISSSRKQGRGRKVERPHLYWGPLLALYTGARANEIACLDVADFIMQAGIPCIQIRHVARAKTNVIAHQSSSTKRTKNKDSRRLIPIHPDLYELGLQDYLDDLKDIGATRFFPHLPKDSRDKRDRYLSRDVNDYLKKVGVHEPRTKVLHSFRDTVCDMLGVSDMDDVQADQWTGHKNQSVKGRHYRSKVALELHAKRGFEALNFPFLDLDALKYPKGCWNQWLAANIEP